MAKRYQVYRSNDKEEYSLVAETTNKYFKDTDALPNRTYYYKVRQVDGPLPGNFSNVFSVSAPDTQAPTVPVFIGADSASFSATLYWSASVDNDGVSFYSVYRSDVDSSSFSLIDTVGATTFSDSGLSQGTNYFYRLTATDLSGNTSGFSSILSLTTTTESDIFPPTVPVFVSAISSSSEITLNWSASTDNVAVSHYNIYRSTTTSSFTLIDTSSIITYTDSNLPLGPYFYYKLSAVDTSNNESDLSSTIEIFVTESIYYELYEVESSDGESIYYFGLAYELFETASVVPTEFEIIDGLITASLSIDTP